MRRGQAERLMPLLQSLLATQGLNWRDFDGFGVGVGPGNFTGIRIAVSAARGLALATGKPAIGSSSFEVAFASERLDPAAQVYLSAPRDTVYAQCFRDGQPDGLATVETPAANALPRQMHDIDWQASGLECLARMTAQKLALGQTLPRPSPLYVRAADAAPPRDPAPVILA